MESTDWDRVQRVLGIELTESVRADLVARYSESHRAYHTLQHLAECFS